MKADHKAALKDSQDEISSFTDVDNIKAAYLELQGQLEAHEAVRDLEPAQGQEAKRQSLGEEDAPPEQPAPAADLIPGLERALSLFSEETWGANAIRGEIARIKK